MNKIFKVFICNGENESGSYVGYGKSYVEGARNFADHANVCGRNKSYGSVWTDIGRKEGYPETSTFLIDEKGKRLLLFDSGETTTFSGH